MERLIITGGKTVQGEIAVNGAKNHALKAIPAALLFTHPVTIHNVPLLEDVLRMIDIVRAIGGTVNVQGSTIVVQGPAEFDGILPMDLAPKLRASVLLIGPLLARFGHVVLPYPGGDNIGKRPIDFFLDFARAMGATVEERDGAVAFTAPEGGLRGTHFFFPLQSHTGTETMMLAAAAAHGTTIIENASCEPEVVALAQWLQDSGVHIEGAGTHTMSIEGAPDMDALTPAEHMIIPDRLEAGTFLILGAATNSELTVTGCEPKHLRSLLHTFELMGIKTEATDSSVTVFPHGPMHPQSIVTHEYPGFPTDLQAPMTVLLTQATGASTVRETIYEGRLFYTELLNTLGADITLIDEYRVTITGPAVFHGGVVHSPDIRAGIALVIAGAIGHGETVIEDIYQIDRGYENIEKRLQAIGLDIQRVND